MSDRNHAAPGEAANNAVAPERLAALLDGNLSEQERERLLKQLIQSPSDVALLANVAAVLREIEKEPDTQPKTAPRVREPAAPAWHRRLHKRTWIATAAVLVVTSITWIATRGPSAAALGPARYVAMLDGSSRRLPPDWDGQPWATTRGSDDVVVGSRARAVRIGARLVDLQIAVNTSDPAASTIAADLARLVGGLPSSGAISSRFENIGRRAGESPASLQAELRDAANAARIAAGEQAADLGSWLEAARLAAARQDAAYFRGSTSRTVLDEITRHESTTAEMKTTAERVRSTVASGTPPWTRIAADLEQLLATAGSGA